MEGRAWTSFPSPQARRDSGLPLTTLVTPDPLRSRCSEQAWTFRSPRPSHQVRQLSRRPSSSDLI